MKKAFDWLNAHGLDYTFHDYKTAGINKTKLREWLLQKPIAEIVNTKSTTFKNLTKADQEKLQITGQFLDLVIEQPSMIKRPVVETQHGLLIGFKPDIWEKDLL